MVAVVMSLAETQQSSSEGGVGSSGVCGKENFLFWVRPAEICDTTSTFNVNKTTQSENQVQDIHHKWLCIVFYCTNANYQSLLGKCHYAIHFVFFT